MSCPWGTDPLGRSQFSSKGPNVGRDGRGRITVLHIGDDWDEDHHDIAVIDETGRLLVRRRLDEGVGGIEKFHEVVADHLPEDSEAQDAVVGIETDRGPWIQALLAAGYTVYPRMRG